MRPTAICSGPVDAHSLPKRHCSLCWHQWFATKCLLRNVWAGQAWQAEVFCLLQMHDPLEGPVFEQLPSIGLLWAICGFGWAQSQGDKGCGVLISPSQYSFRIWCSWGGFNIGKMVPVCGLPWSEAYQVAPGNRGRWLTLACSGAPPKGATEQRNNSDCPSSLRSSTTLLSLSCMSLVPPKLPTICWHPGCMSASECVYRQAL